VLNIESRKAGGSTGNLIRTLPALPPVIADNITKKLEFIAFKCPKPFTGASSIVFWIQRCMSMARSSEIKFLIISIPLLLLAIIVILMQPVMAPDAVYKSVSMEEDPWLPLDKIKLPPGFAIEIYATGVTGARQMALSPNGTLYVGTIGAGNVYALPDNNKDGKADGDQ
jgi:hypothetical protein